MAQDHNMKFYFAQEYGEDIYFSSVEFNGLFKKSKNDEYVEYLGPFENEDLQQESLHSRVFLDGNKIFFLPYNGTGISVYDISSKKIDFIRIDSDTDLIAYVNAIKLGELWLLFPRYSHWKVLWLDIENMRVWEDGEISSLIETKTGNYEIDLFATILSNEKIYISFYGGSFVGILDIKRKEFCQKEFAGYRLVNMSQSGEDMWITTLEGDVIRWNETKGIERIYEFNTPMEHPFFYVLNWNYRLFLMPFLLDEIYEYDNISDSWNSISSIMPSEYTREIYGERPLIVGCTKRKDCLELYPRSGNGILVLTRNNVEYVPIKGDPIVSEILEGDHKRMMIKQLRIDGIINEDDNNKLVYFLETIS